MGFTDLMADMQFLSPPSARRATLSIMSHSSHSAFLSPPSARRATSQEPALAPFSSISIPALREEGDAPGGLRPARLFYFYPRPPRGGRLVDLLAGHAFRQFLSPPSARRATLNGGYWDNEEVFLSPPSARRATGVGCGVAGLGVISIPALREEGDAGAAACRCG